MNNNEPFVYFFYIWSFLFFLSCNHWFFLWVALELNSITFIVLLNQNSNINQISSTITYFFVQSVSSLLLIFSVFNNTGNIENWVNISPSFAFVLAALLINIASAPLQSWFYPVVLSSSSNLMWLLLSAQNIIPIVLILTIKPELTPLLFFSLVVSGLYGPLLGLTQNNINSIIVFSSISHTAWLLTAILSGFDYWSFYFFIYGLTIFFLSSYSNNTNLQNFTENNLNISLLSIAIFLSLGGLPPLVGFFPNILILNSCFSGNLLFILVILLLGSMVDIFIYVRFSHISLSTNNNNLIWAQYNTTNNTFPLILIIGITLLSWLSVC